jgi:hypothetical protein
MILSYTKWLTKRFKLENAKEALQALFAKERDGRILLDINQ